MSISVTQIQDLGQLVFAIDHDIQNLSETNLEKYQQIESFAKTHGVPFYSAGYGTRGTGSATKSWYRRSYRSEKHTSFTKTSADRRAVRLAREAVRSVRQLQPNVWCDSCARIFCGKDRRLLDLGGRDNLVPGSHYCPVDLHGNLASGCYRKKAATAILAKKIPLVVARSFGSIFS